MKPTGRGKPSIPPSSSSQAERRSTCPDRIYALGVGVSYLRGSGDLEYAPTDEHVDRTVQILVAGDLLRPSIVAARGLGSCRWGEHICRSRGRHLCSLVGRTQGDDRSCSIFERRQLLRRNSKSAEWARSSCSAGSTTKTSVRFPGHINRHGRRRALVPVRARFRSQSVQDELRTTASARPAASRARRRRCRSRRRTRLRRDTGS